MEKIGQVNRYVCRSCRRSTLTINLNSGTTPFGVTCPACGKPESVSSMYQTNLSRVTVTHAFYRPTREEFDGLDAPRQEFVLAGAMLFEPLREARPLPEPDPPYTNGETLLAFMERTYGRSR